MNNTVKCTDGIYRTVNNADNLSSIDGLMTVGDVQEIDYMEERSDDEIEACFIEQEEYEEWMSKLEEGREQGDFNNDDYSEESRP
jgi:hypothetical protein